MMNIAKGGIPWIITMLLSSLVLIILTLVTTANIQSILLFITLIFLLLSLLLLIFFRDPDRVIASDIVAVADGRIRDIRTIEDPQIGSCTQVSTFMNLHNVHVNRSPTAATVLSITRHPGGYLPAFTKESERNERVVLILETPEGQLIKIIQIAGTLARRIVAYVQEGDQLKPGDKMGLIRLGSRVDIFLPSTYELNCHVQQRVKAGEDTIAIAHV